MINNQEKIAELRKKILSDEEYMSDTNNWCCVHITKYMPKRNKNGDMFVETTGMATDYALPRATVHTTLNQVVGNNIGGNWDEASIVILAPYNDIVNKNCNPQEVSVDDTYFVANPDTGLVLPESTYIILPSTNIKDLYVFDEHGVTYKTDHYSDDEIKTILSYNSANKELYEQYMSGDVPEYDVKWILGYDEKLLKVYENAKNKKAFMRGVLEEDRYIILNKLLRDHVVEKTLKQMGYRYVFAHEDETSEKVANVARANGIRGDSGNKGHSFSIEGALEIKGSDLYEMEKILAAKNPKNICSILSESWHSMKNEIIKSLLDGSPISDVYKVYTDTFNQYIASAKGNIEFYDDIKQKKLRLEYLQKLEQGGIKGYNKFLDITLHRSADKMTAKLNQAINEIRCNPQIYEEIKTVLKTQEMINPLLLSKKQKTL